MARVSIEVVSYPASYRLRQLDTIQKSIDRDILKTPTGIEREKLTTINILLLDLIEKIELEDRHRQQKEG